MLAVSHRPIGAEELCITTSLMGDWLGCGSGAYSLVGSLPRQSYMIQDMRNTRSKITKPMVPASCWPTGRGDLEEKAAALCHQILLNLSSHLPSVSKLSVSDQRLCSVALRSHMIKNRMLPLAQTTEKTATGRWELRNHLSANNNDLCASQILLQKLASGRSQSCEGFGYSEQRFHVLTKNRDYTAVSQDGCHLKGSRSVWLSVLRSCWVELLLTLSESDISPSARLWCQGVQPSLWDVHRDTQQGQMRRNFSSVILPLIRHVCDLSLALPPLIVARTNEEGESQQVLLTSQCELTLKQESVGEFVPHKRLNELLSLYKSAVDERQTEDLADLIKSPKKEPFLPEWRTVCVRAMCVSSSGFGKLLLPEFLECPQLIKPQTSSKHVSPAGIPTDCLSSLRKKRRRMSASFTLQCMKPSGLIEKPVPLLSCEGAAARTTGGNDTPAFKEEMSATSSFTKNRKELDRCSRTRESLSADEDDKPNTWIGSASVAHRTLRLHKDDSDVVQHSAGKRSVHLPARKAEHSSFHKISASIQTNQRLAGRTHLSLQEGVELLRDTEESLKTRFGSILWPPLILGFLSLGGVVVFVDQFSLNLAVVWVTPVLPAGRGAVGSAGGAALAGMTTIFGLASSEPEKPGSRRPPSIACPMNVLAIRAPEGWLELNIVSITEEEVEEFEEMAGGLSAATCCSGLMQDFLSTAVHSALQMLVVCLTNKPLPVFSKPAASELLRVGNATMMPDYVPESLAGSCENAPPGGLTLPPPLLLPLQPHLPADGAGRQQHQAGRQQHQPEVGDGGSVRVEAVRHGGDHDAGDEDHHAERDGAAVAGKLRAAGGCRQLDLVNQGDVQCRHGDWWLLGGFGLLRGRWGLHCVLVEFVWHRRIRMNRLQLAPHCGAVGGSWEFVSGQAARSAGGRCKRSRAAVMSLQFGDEEFQKAWQELDEPQLDGWELFTETMGVQIHRRYDRVGRTESVRLNRTSAEPAAGV
ncbi:hypothetical protein CCH79_00016491 [Gambusia affinis]|uniref:Uncharacterized protein n=1 Tax=Gambusia affinis TaxID=33528 RepID=A0A315UXU9_GAMAF|nr:hypothetical protein CCH79_00016491 [Gambusia affinis]